VLEDVEESQVRVQPPKKTRVDLGGPPRTNRGTSVPVVEERQNQSRPMAEPEVNVKNYQGSDNDQ